MANPAEGAGGMEMLRPSESHRSSAAPPFYRADNPQRVAKPQDAPPPLQMVTEIPGQRHGSRVRCGSRCYSRSIQIPGQPMLQGRLSQPFAMILGTALLLGSTPSARAEEWDKQSFWYGFLLGSSTTVCELLENGLLTKNDARDWLQTLFKADPDIPAVSQSSAKAELRGNADFKDCPVPR